jgi:hypothetical protein
VPHEYPSDPINQHRIGRPRPTRVLARKQPDLRAIATNFRWQHLIEESGRRVLRELAVHFGLSVWVTNSTFQTVASIARIVSVQKFFFAAL